MSESSSIVRLAQTARHLRATQVANRILRNVYRPQPRRFEAVRRFPSHGWVTGIERRPALSEDLVFDALNERHSITDAAGWSLDGATRLWTYHLHYFDDLCAQGSDERRDMLARLVARWIDENAPGSGPGWEPYPLSRRIVNWLRWGLSGGPLEARALDSLASQADFLSRTIEHHLKGNHLIANAKALVFAGTCLDCAESARWLAEGRRCLERELSEQILADGGHHERSPMYHALVLEDMLDLVNLGGATGRFECGRLRSVIPAMQRWLSCMSHPDGRIALFNDATLDGSPAAAELLAYGRRLGIAYEPAARAGLVWLAGSGYARLESGHAVLLTDAGSVGPDHQPGHAHAQTLSFELSLCGRRVVVDSGTSTYAPGPERDRQRGTRAHNTVCLDGRNSSDTWGAFRVGRRARTRLLEALETRELLKLQASHDGYNHGPGGVTHTRSWMLRDGSLVISDGLTGHAEHSFEAALHLHPSVEVRPIPGGRFELVLPWADSTARVTTDPRYASALERTTWHPEFGVSEPSLRIVTRGDARVPVEVETVLDWPVSRADVPA